MTNRFDLTPRSWRVNKSLIGKESGIAPDSFLLFKLYCLCRLNP